MIVCPNCQTENPAGARFCLNCGTALAAARESRRELKFATALFADLVGSTSLAENQDPEVVQAVVGATFDRLAQEVDRYGGLLEKFMGDAILAVFGVPKAHEDDPERAVRAALEMLAVLSELNRGFSAAGKPQLAMRIGIEAGDVLVDTERVATSRDRMLTGDAVNTAARLESAAQPGEVIVGPGVWASTKETIEYTELDQLTLKGKAEPVPAWRAIRVKAKRRGERPALGMEAKLVGRDEELTVLKQTLHRVETEGRPALVTIVGPAGVGKSRLAAELAKHVEGLPQIIYWRSGRCLAYGNTSYSALADAIKAQCEILEDDPADVASAKIDDAVEELFGDPSVAPALRALLGGGETSALSREELFDVWRRFLERLAARYPLVVELDDLHWADTGLLDFVEHVADWAQGPIMLLVQARPELFEIRPSWGGGKRNAASIYLDPLSAEEDAAMIDDLLPGAMNDDLRALIVERSEGNPLYTEEIVRLLIDRGVIRATEASRWEVAGSVADVEVPRSIQGLISTRLDGLPDDEKSLLQDAAVVGRVFWLGAVAELAGREPGAIRDILGRLRVKELIVPHEPSSFRDEPELSFRHLLIRDGAYDSLPKSLRAEKHLGVARWAAARASDRIDEIAELIASHHLEALGYLDELGEASDTRAEVERETYRWARAAARRAASVWLQAEAIAWYRRAADLAIPVGVPIEERVTLASDYADACWGSADTKETERACRSFLELAQEAGDAAAAGRALARLGRVVFQEGRDDEAREHLEQAVVLLEPLGETEGLAFALGALGWYRWRRGHNAEAEPVLRRSIAIAERIGAADLLAAATMDLAVVHSQAGRADEALALMEEAHVLAKAAGDFPILARTYTNLSALLAAYDPARAKAILLEGRELTLKAGADHLAAWIKGNIADLSLFMGDLDEAEAEVRETVAMAERMGDEPLLGMRLGSLAEILVQRGRIEEAERTMERTLPIAAANPEPQGDIYRHLTSGRIAAANGDGTAAIDSFRRSIAIAREHSFDWAPEAFPEIVRALLDAGDRAEASTYRDLAGSTSPLGVALAAVVGGLLEPDPAAATVVLRRAADELEALGDRVELARTLIDLGTAMRRAGEDPRTEWTRAREILLRSDARLHLPQVEAALASLEAEARE